MPAFYAETPECPIRLKAWDFLIPYRGTLKGNDTKPVIPGKKNRKVPIWHDQHLYKQRWRIENVFCHIKDLHQLATRYDKLTRTFRDAVALAIIYKYWL